MLALRSRGGLVAEVSGARRCSFLLAVASFHLAVCRSMQKIFDSLIYPGFLIRHWVAPTWPRVCFCRRLTESDARFGPRFHNLYGGVTRRDLLQNAGVKMRVRACVCVARS